MVNVGAAVNRKRQQGLFVLGGGQRMALAGQVFLRISGIGIQLVEHISIAAAVLHAPLRCEQVLATIELHRYGQTNAAHDIPGVGAVVNGGGSGVGGQGRFAAKVQGLFQRFDFAAFLDLGGNAKRLAGFGINAVASQYAHGPA